MTKKKKKKKKNKKNKKKKKKKMMMMMMIVMMMVMMRMVVAKIGLPGLTLPSLISKDPVHQVSISQLSASLALEMLMPVLA